MTYDQKTVPPLPAELYAEGEGHAGVIFVDDQTIANNDFGTLTRALIFLWEQSSAEGGKTVSVSWKSRAAE